MAKVQAKICGIKTVAVALAAAETGADMLGLVFYPPSPRYVSLETAQTIVRLVQTLPSEKRPKLVGLFVNESLEKLAEIAQALSLDYLQLSGDETPEFCEQAAKVKPVLKAVRLSAKISRENALELVKAYAIIPNVTVLLDTPKQGFYGGTGETGDWEAARAVCQTYAVILAGGLTPENVAEAIAAVQPYGVDVSSGVEITGKSGEKDLSKIKKFLAEAKR